MNEQSRQLLRTLGTILLIASLGYLLWRVRFTLTYLVISGVLALIGKPVVDLLTGAYWKFLRLSRSLAAAITLLLMVGIFAGILSVFLPALMAELKVLGNVDFEGLYEELRLEVQQLQNFFLPESRQTVGENALLRPGLSSVFSVDSVSDTFAGLLGSLGNIVFAIFSILFITFFFLREKFLFRNIILSFIPDKLEPRVLHVAPNLRNTLGRYFAGLLMQITIITTLVSVGLKLMGFHNTIVIGFFAGLINVIPYLGPIIGMSFGLILGLAQTVGQYADPPLASATLSILGVFAVTQLIDNFLLQPIIFSTSIRAHPLEIFIVISFAASLAGISGMIVAVPVYSVLRLLAAEFFAHLKFVRWLTGTKLSDEQRPA